MVNFECFACRRVSAMLPDDTTKCPNCGSTNGQLISKERLKEGVDAGAFWNIDPNTGGPAKRKKR
jgi:ribosomal protein L40E